MLFSEELSVSGKEREISPFLLYITHGDKMKDIKIKVGDHEVSLGKILNDLNEVESGKTPDLVAISRATVQGMIDKILALQHFKDFYSSLSKKDKLQDGVTYIDRKENEIQVFKIKPHEEFLFKNVEEYPFKGMIANVYAQYSSTGKVDIDSISVYDLVRPK